MLSIAFAALMMLASFPMSHTGASNRAPHMVGYLPLSTSEADFRPASMGLSAAQVGVVVAATTNPTYDEQIGTTFTQDWSYLTYNVTALAQTDSDGYGPAYILNGLTSAGYWYQVGISYHWPSSNGAYNPSFGFSYQVYGPNGKAVYPLTGGSGLTGFSKAVHSGDSVLLSLTFSGTSVQMLAQDWNTGATARTSYTSNGASTFIGNPYRPTNAQGFFSGLMTEWYHVLPYSGNEGKVTYTNRAFALTSAWMWIDEFDNSAGKAVFLNQTRSPVTYANEDRLYPFASNGATLYSSAHEFITGLLSTASSRVTLTPAVAEKTVPNFDASYTLAGLRQSADIAAGTATVVEADPGTSVTVSVNSSSSSALETWVFNRGMGGSAVTFKAGANVTFVYYHLVQQLVSYQVVGGSPPPTSSAPQLTYAVPPVAASATPAQTTTAQVVGSTPLSVYALFGSQASVNATIAGRVGERWAAVTQNWTISGPNSIPVPINFVQQYEVKVSYSIVGGGTPANPPAFTSISLGSPKAIEISENGATGWFDAGSAYSFSSVINGSAPGERWLDAGGNGAAPSAISSPDAVLTEAYTHQYYANLAANNPKGGSVSPASGWFQAGSNLHASALSSPQWQFKMWNGSGPGAYKGTSQTIDVPVKGPLSEVAAFYVQLAIEADRGTNIAYAFGSETGTVQAGSTKTVYVPPSSNLTLRASPSVFVYSFASWEGTGISNDAKPLLVLAIDSPTAVVGTSAYNYPVIAGTGAAVFVLLAASLWIRGRRRRDRFGSFVPSTT